MIVTDRVLRALSAQPYQHTCTLTRPADGTAWTEPSAGTVQTGVRCSYQETITDEDITIGGRPVRVRAQLWLPYGTDVDEGDVVSALTGPDGAALTSRALRVDGVARHRSHTECVIV